MLKVGLIIRMERRLWRVGLVNASRARLDPLSGKVVRADPTSGRTFQSYGDSINIGPNSFVDVIGESELEAEDANAYARYLRMEEMAMELEGDKWREKLEHVDSYIFTSDEEDKGMADELTAEEGTVATAAVVPTQTTAQKNKARLEALKAKKASAKGGTKAAKTPREKKEKVMQACNCGCGEQTGSYFVPGHDARFKGWLLKIERGDATPEDLLKKSIREKYKWVKSGHKGEAGVGMRPTTNYKGEPHSGYLLD